MSLSISAGPAAVAAARTSRDAVYRAVWRWHFYAGLICLPFLILLSATGAIYLFKGEIERNALAHRAVVAPSARAPLEPDRLVFNAMQAVPGGDPVSYTEPAGPTGSALVTLTEGARRTLVFLNPYTGDVLDRVSAERDPMGIVRRLHSLTLFGTAANALVEIVAGLAIILVVTGAYLWWPRGRTTRLMALRETPRRRVWWRDLHAATGLFAGAGLLFLALTGLPWSVWWGQELRAWSNRAGLGQPSALWAGKPVSTLRMGERLESAGWALADAPLPRSGSAKAPSIGIDRAVATLREMGMPTGFELALPVGETGVFAASAYPRDVTRQRMISLDRYSGQPILDLRFADLGPVARAIQFGIGIHKGEHWGRANQLVMLAFCLGTILLCLSAAVMWWKRRPAGGLGTPPWPRDRRIVAGVTALMLGLGALFPMTGLAILALLGLDLAAQTLRAAARA
ncbi:PepSY domain-containing protein [Methylobacterium sp. B4]|uniref:PepSY-associated TM helix domain-containing protein n=1 Tax=Methylobacterium sp. B4 TaxID=1938755 RepID=UPI000D77110C|nr:PepSY domain-containing protein [Methylobacterium sp. B4]PXW66819.1 putative iron-regulated membrane protein [Methylobacterium sp. B4]